MQHVGDPKALKSALPPEGIGFVPTMGYLHEGHLALVRRARAENPFVAVSIFVNPLQFGPGEDYERYPRDLERDLGLLEKEGVDLVFAPEPDEFYPPDFSSFVEVTGPLTERLEGARRPGHFRGVTTVLTKLFHLVRPARAYFGEKDYQQLAVVRKLVRDLDFGIEIVGVPTVREPDGLALSSRNVYLTPAHREAAPGIYRALLAVREAARQGASVEEARAVGLDALNRIPDLAVEYLEIVHPTTLEPLTVWVEGARALFAGRFPEVRLIDNLEVYP